MKEFIISKSGKDFRNTKAWKEQWLPVVGFEDLYSVSDAGRVRSLKKSWESGNGRVQHQDEIIKKQPIVWGYHVVGLHRGGISRLYKIHRLVAIAFIPNPENKPQVNHKDGNKLNNRVDNLEWCTAKENVVHAHKNNLVKYRTGESRSEKLTNKDVLYIRASSILAKVLAKKFDVCEGTIYSIRSRRNWKHI